MKKKLMSLISMGMVMCMLAGCGGGETIQEPGGQEEMAQESVNAEALEEPGEVDSGTAAGLYPDYLNLESFRPIVKEGEDVTLKIVTSRDAVANNDIMDSWFPNFIEQKLNIGLDIEELSGENAGERKNLMLASNNLPDMLFFTMLSRSDIVQYGVEGGMLLPISDYFSEELTPNILRTLEEYPEIEPMFAASDGKMYTLPIIMASGVAGAGTIGTERVFIDTTYLEAADLEAPKTLDEFVDMCRAFKALNPADMGVDEIYPIVSVGIFEPYLMKAFGWVGESPTSPSWDEAEQAVVIPCLQEKYGDYIRLMNTLYSEGMLHPDYYTMDDTEARAIMAAKKEGVMADWAPYLSLQTGWEDFIAAPPLSSEWCDTPISQRLSAIDDSYIYVSADTEYPEVCVRLLDYFYSVEGSVYSTSGAPEGSEDTLGMINGFVVSEDGTKIERPDEEAAIEAGEYESAYEWIINKLTIAQRINSNNNYTGFDVLGVENPPEQELDMTNPDEHYRYQCYVAQNEYLVNPLPSPFMSVEQSNKYADLRTVLSDYVSSETAKFVVGQRPLDEIDQFFEELKEMNSEEFLELCQEVYANYSR